jgi:ribokinase
LRVGVVGEICEDLYEGPHLAKPVGRPGGIAANFAVHAGRAGAQVVLVGAVGDDDAGARLLAALRDVGPAVDTSRVRRRPGPSTRQRLRVDGGERVFCGYDPGVARDLALEPEDERALAACDAIACSDGLLALLERCLGLGPPVVCDFSRDTDGNEPGHPEAWLAPWVDRLAVAFVGGETGFAGPLAALSRRTPALVVLTAGAAGAFAFRRGQTSFQPALPTTVVDTNGCGDAFQGAFTARWAAGATIAHALAAGAARAAAVAAGYGAQSR